jgi:hypothetical protein
MSVEEQAPIFRRLFGSSRWEMRKCDRCGHEVIRPQRLEERMELPCGNCNCKSERFHIYDPIWAERKASDYAPND